MKQVLFKIFSATLFLTGAQTALAQTGAPAIQGANPPSGGPIDENSWKNLFTSGSLGNRGATFNNAISKYIDILLILATVAAIFFIIYYSYLMITAQGNEEQFDRAKKGLLAAVIGIIIVLTSLVIATVVRNVAMFGSGGI